MASTQCQVGVKLPEEMLKKLEQLEQFKQNLNKRREQLENLKEFSMNLFRIVCPTYGEEEVKKKILMNAVENFERMRERFLQEEQRLFNEVCACLKCLTSEKLHYWENFLELV